MANQIISAVRIILLLIDGAVGRPGISNALSSQEFPHTTTHAINKSSKKRNGSN
jgi:hypothetical protein